MTQNRKPPAYQEYASTMLADISFRSMNMEARGLLYTMRLECWANGRMPSEIESLSTVLGKPVTSDMLKAVASFFAIDDKQITSPELENYRAYLDERREKQSKGGRKGAKITNTKCGGIAKAMPTTNHKQRTKTKVTGNPQVPRQGSDESLVQSSSTKQSQNKLIEGKNYNYLDKDGIDSLLGEFEDDIPF
jgi:hypothetical protein